MDKPRICEGPCGKCFHLDELEEWISQNRTQLDTKVISVFEWMMKDD